MIAITLTKKVDFRQEAARKIKAVTRTAARGLEIVT